MFRSKSLPTKMKAPATHESIPMTPLAKSPSVDPEYRPPVPPKDVSRPQPAAQTEEERKAEHDRQTLATSQGNLAETKSNNAATQYNNSRLRKLGYAGMGLTALGGATALGLGINTA